MLSNSSWRKQKGLLFHLGITSVIVLGTEVIRWLVDASDNFFDCMLLNPPESWKKPGGVSSFSLSRMSLESMSITWLINGLRFAFDWVQKRATLIYLRTSSWGNSCISGSTKSSNFPSSYSCHACLIRFLVPQGKRDVLSGYILCVFDDTKVDREWILHYQYSCLQNKISQFP